MDVRDSLALRTVPQGRSTSGFLLGGDADIYRHCIDYGGVWVVEQGSVTGFSVVMPDALVRASTLWHRRHTIRFDNDTRFDDSATTAYYDQLAVLPSSRRVHAVALAVAGLLQVLEWNSCQMFATTVLEPINNVAAVPLLQQVGAQRVGEIRESYSGVGALTSQVWMATRANLEAWLRARHSTALASIIARVAEQFTVRVEPTCARPTLDRSVHHRSLPLRYHQKYGSTKSQ